MTFSISFGLWEPYKCILVSVTSSGSSTASFEGSIGISNLASYLTYVFYSVMIYGCSDAAFMSVGHFGTL